MDSSQKNPTKLSPATAIWNSIMMKKVKFNIFEAKNGAPVVTRDGRHVRILAYDIRRGEGEICAAITEEDPDNGSKLEHIALFSKDGRTYPYKEGLTQPSDLFIMEEEEEIPTFEREVEKFYGIASGMYLSRGERKLYAEKLMNAARKELEEEIKEKWYKQGKIEGVLETEAKIPHWHYIDDWGRKEPVIAEGKYIDAGNRYLIIDELKNLPYDD